MTIYNVLLLFTLSAFLSYILRQRPSGINIFLQILLGIIFLYSVVISRTIPNKISNKPTVTTKKYTIKRISEQIIKPLKVKNYDPYHPVNRVAKHPYFDENNNLQLEQKIVTSNVGGVCPNGVQTNDDGSIKIPSRTIFMHPRVDLEFCQYEMYGRLADRILVGFENEKVKWQYSLLVEKEKHNKIYRDLFRVIGKSMEFLILYNYDEYEVKIISAQTGKEVYPMHNNLKLEFRQFGPATYDEKNKILYKANNDYGYKSSSVLMQIKLITGERDVLFELPEQESMSIFGGRAPRHIKSISYMSKLNLIAFYTETSSSGRKKDKLYIYSIDERKIIFEKDYQPRQSAELIVNQQNSSFGLSNWKKIEHYEIKKKITR